MATQQSLTFFVGEDWIIQLFCCNADGSPMTNLEDVEFTISTLGSTAPLLDQTLETGAQIVNAETGEVAFHFAPGAQGGLAAGRYAYQAAATQTTGTVSVQAYGQLLLIQRI